MPPSVYTVILTWNHAGDALECLESFRQIDYANHHLVIVDNGSEDNTVAAIAERFPAVHIIENQANLGFAEGNNVGIRYALAHGAEYVFILNDDTVICPDTLARMVEVGEQEPGIGILCPSIIAYHERSTQYWGTSIDWRNGATEQVERPLEQVSDTAFAPGCALLIKASVIAKIGLFDLAYFLYFEDTDWSIRCVRAGYRVVIVPNSRIYHKGTVHNQGHVSPNLMFFYRRNQYLFMRRYSHWYRFPFFAGLYTVQCLLQTRTLLKSHESDKATAILDGFWAGVTGRYGATRVAAPSWFRTMVLGALRWTMGGKREGLGA